MSGKIEIEPIIGMCPCTYSYGRFNLLLLTKVIVDYQYRLDGVPVSISGVPIAEKSLKRYSKWQWLCWINFGMRTQIKKDQDKNKIIFNIILSIATIPAYWIGLQIGEYFYGVM